MPGPLTRRESCSAGPPTIRTKGPTRKSDLVPCSRHATPCQPGAWVSVRSKGLIGSVCHTPPPARAYAFVSFQAQELSVGVFWRHGTGNRSHASLSESYAGAQRGPLPGARASGRWRWPLARPVFIGENAEARRDCASSRPPRFLENFLNSVVETSTRVPCGDGWRLPPRVANAAGRAPKPPVAHLGRPPLLTVRRTP